jgi:CRP/FNR family cyclic AMP-dependent transcriptional regulator
MIGNPRTSPRRKPGVSGTSSEPPEQTPLARANGDIVALLVDEPHVPLASGQVLFTEGDPPSCMYVVKSGTLRIRSGGVIYEDVGPGGIVGEMALVERYPARSATVYALTDCELVEVDEARFSALVAEAPLCAAGHADPVAPAARDGSPLSPRAPGRARAARNLRRAGSGAIHHIAKTSNKPARYCR